MKKYLHALVVLGLPLALMACQSREAEQRAAEAEKQAQEATVTAARMRAEADEAAKVRTAHAEARTKLQKDFDALDRKATYLREKAAKITGPAKKNADAALSELDSRRTTAKASLNRLADDTDPAWDATKKTAEEDVAAVGRAVDALERTITKK